MQHSKTRDTKQGKLDTMREFADNTTTRLPVLFLLDNSSSMRGIVRGDNMQTIGHEHRDGIEWNIVTGDNLVLRMDELNNGFQRFVEDILGDTLARLSADVAIMTFAATIRTLREFGPVRDDDARLRLDISKEDETRLGEGVEQALEALNARKEMYKAHGVDYFQPWLIVISDGVPTSTRHRELTERLRQLAEERKLTVFAFGIHDADLNELACISPVRPPMSINTQKFTELFAWLSRSVRMVSMSMPGEGVTLTPPPGDVWQV